MRNHFLFVLLCGWASVVWSQQEIPIKNYSFEADEYDYSVKNITGWSDCGTSAFNGESPPDIHPSGGSPVLKLIQDKQAYIYDVMNTDRFHRAGWMVSNRSYEGNNYLGMVVRDNNTFEFVGQRLSSPLQAGQCYAFSVYLSKSPDYYSYSQATKRIANFSTPAVLRIYGGNSDCNKVELLAESFPVENTYWREFKTKLKPNKTYSHIILQAYYNTPIFSYYNGHVLVDKISNLIPIDCMRKVPDQELAYNDASPPLAKVDPPTKPQTSTPHKKNPPENNRSQSTPHPKEYDRADPDLEENLLNLRRSDLSEGKTFRIQKLEFATNSDIIEEESFEALDELYEFLSKNEDLVIEIGGHTNTLPETSYADQLSLKRAQAVANYLTKAGMDEKRIFTKGYGKTKPIIANDRYSSVARQKNQRVEIKIISMRR